MMLDREAVDVVDLEDMALSRLPGDDDVFVGGYVHVLSFCLPVFLSSCLCSCDADPSCSVWRQGGWLLMGGSIIYLESASILHFISGLRKTQTEIA